VITSNLIQTALIPAQYNILSSTHQVVAYVILSKLGVKVATISIILLFL